MSSNTDQLRKIRDQVINFTSSPLYHHRTQNHYLPVIGEGNHHASIIFIAEAPGIQEARTGHHFVGPSGQIFDQLLNSINLKRQDIYLTNIIKDKLPQNRDPQPQEIEAYAPFLLNQLQIIKPKTIVTLGRFSTNYLLSLCHQPIKPLSQIHGQPITISTSYGTSNHIPMFHPSAALYNPSLISQMKQDFLILKN